MPPGKVVQNDRLFRDPFSLIQQRQPSSQFRLEGNQPVDQVPTEIDQSFVPSHAVSLSIGQGSFLLSIGTDRAAYSTRLLTMQSVSRQQFRRAHTMSAGQFTENRIPMIVNPRRRDR